MKPVRITRRNPRIKAIRKKREKQPEKILFYTTAEDIERQAVEGGDITWRKLP